MSERSAAPWRRLAPLAVAVLAVHLVLLAGGPVTLAPERGERARFVTRTITPPAPAPAPPAAAPMPAATPPAVAVAPAPRPAEPRPALPSPPKGPTPQAAPAPAPQAAPPVAVAQPEPPPAATGSRAGGLSAAPPAPEPPQVANAVPFTPQVLAIPEPARIHFEVEEQVRGLASSARAQLDWRHDGKEYRVRLEVTGAAGRPDRVQSSTGRVTDAGLAPGYFSDRSRTEQATHFDRDQGRLVFSNNSPQAPIVEGMQDRLSALVQLSVLIAGEPAKFPPGTRIAIPTATTREAGNWIFSVEGEEDLELPGGRVRALKLQRLPQRQFDQKVELWLAPRMDYAPARLRLTNPNGDTADYRWSSTDRG